MKNTEKTFEFYKKMKGYKVNIISRAGAESYVGLVADILEDEDKRRWVELVPFVAKNIEKKVKLMFPDLETLQTVTTTLYKRLDTIETVIVLDKPDKFLDEQPNKDSEDK